MESVSARVTRCPSCTVLRGHLSLSGATVGSVGHFRALVPRGDHWDKRDAFLSASDSQYPHSMADRLRVSSGTSREPLSDSPLGYILRNEILALQKAWPKYELSSVQSLSSVRLFVTPWTAACQTPPPMGFSRQDYWSGSAFPSPGQLPDPGIEPWSPAPQADSLLSEPPGNV